MSSEQNTARNCW